MRGKVTIFAAEIGFKTVQKQFKEMKATRTNLAVSLPDYMLADLNAEARRKGVTVSRLIEDRLEESLYKPNAETLAAIEECKSGVELPRVDVSSIEAMTKSILG